MNKFNFFILWENSFCFSFFLFSSFIGMEIQKRVPNLILRNHLLKIESEM